MAPKFNLVLAALGLMASTAAFAQGEARAVARGSSAEGSSEVSIAKLRSPRWSNSLQGLGSLNMTRNTVANDRSSRESQVGPLRLGQSGMVPPPSFTGTGYMRRTGSDSTF